MTSRIDGGVREQHGEPVDADPLARGGRHAVLQRADVVLVHPVRLLVARARAGPACSSKRGRWSIGSLSSE